MTDDELIETAMTHARAIFKAPALTYDPGLVFQEIRGFDSVQAVQFVLALEEAFGVMLSEQDIDDMRTMGDMLSTLRAKTGAG